MKVLVIDDERVFPFEATYARSSAEAIDNLSDEQEWDEVWFDHDLGLGDDAMMIVKWMGLQHITGVRWSDRIRRAYVHSMNPVGATNIRSRIKDFGIPTYRVGLPPGSSVI